MRLLIFLFSLPIIESFNRDAGFFLLILSSLIFGVKLIRKKLRFDTISLLFLGMIGVFVVTLPFSISIIASAKELARYMSYFIIFHFVREEVAAKNFSIPLLFSFIMFDALFLTILWGVYSLPIFHLEAPANTMNLFFPTFGHNRIALLYMFSIPVLTYYLVTFSGRKRWICAFALLASILLLSFTHARGAMVSLGIGFFLAITLFLGKRRDGDFLKNMRAPMGVTILLLFFTIIFLISSFIFSNFVIPYDQQSTAYSFWKGFYKPIQNEYRIKYLQYAWKGFVRAPLSGTGLGTYRYTSLKYQSAPDQWSWYAHNHIVELFAETGILGGISFILLIGSILVKILFSIRNTSDDSFWKFPLVVSVIALMIHSFLDYDFHFISIFLFFWIYCALLLPVNIQKMSMQFSQKIFYSVYTLLFFCIFLSLFYSQIDFIFLKARDLKMIRSNIVLALAHTMYIFDSGNAESSTRIGDLYTEMGRESDADIWYQRVIVRQPLYSQRAYIEHCKFLLTNEKLEKIDLLRYCPTLQKSVENIEYYSPESNNHLKSELDQSDPSVAQLLLVSQQIELFSPTTRLFHSYTSFYRFLH